MTPPTIPFLYGIQKSFVIRLKFYGSLNFLQFLDNIFCEAFVSGVTLSCLHSTVFHWCWGNFKFACCVLIRSD